MQKQTLAVVGCGNMGGAIVRGLLRGGSPFGRIVAFSPSGQGIPAGIDRAATATEAARVGDVVLLAVKPQVMPSVLEEIGGEAAGKLFVSVAAGTTSGAIEAKLSGGRVVRAMPNTPMLVGKGAVGLASGASATAEDIETAKQLFGDATIVEVNEAQIDAVTAVSGSGPAYFFAFVEALATAGEQAGLSADHAATLARQTCIGAAALLEQSNDSPGVLRKNVTSPGGTTAAALASFETDDLAAMVARAVAAAARRGRELSGDGYS